MNSKLVKNHMFQNVYFLIAVHRSFTMQYVTWKVWNENSKQILKTHKFCKRVRSIWFPTVILLSCLFLAALLVFSFRLLLSSLFHSATHWQNVPLFLTVKQELLRALLCQYVLYSLLELKMTKQIRSMLPSESVTELDGSCHSWHGTYMQKHLYQTCKNIYISTFSTNRELLHARTTSANCLKQYWILLSGDHEAKQNAHLDFYSFC